MQQSLLTKKEYVEDMKMTIKQAMGDLKKHIERFVWSCVEKDCFEKLTYVNSCRTESHLSCAKRKAQTLPRSCFPPLDTLFLVTRLNAGCFLLLRSTVEFCQFLTLYFSGGFAA